MKIYEIDEKLIEGLVQYLGTRPIQECVQPWAVLKELKPLSVEELRDKLVVKPTKKE